MSSRALVFPGGTVRHLPAADVAAHPELTALARLEDAGLALGVVALPGAVEESLYRLNNLPPRLARLYQGLDPLDPDEDIVEEAEGAAMRLLGESYLLDDIIDAVLASLAGLPGPVEVRRAGSDGVAVTGTRAALLAVKRTYTDDWTVQAVLGRLASGGRLGVEARPVLVHAAATRGSPGADDFVTRAARDVLGKHARIAVDESGAITRVMEAAGYGRSVLRIIS